MNQNQNQMTVRAADTDTTIKKMDAGVKPENADLSVIEVRQENVPQPTNEHSTNKNNMSDTDKTKKAKQTRRPRRPRTDLVETKYDEKEKSTAYTKEINGENVTVIYNEKGYPDFEPHAHEEYHPPPVKIEFSGDNYKDFKAANEKIGLTETPSGYTWHHIEDGESMILVPRSIHDSTMGGFPHSGGAALERNKEKSEDNIAVQQEEDK